MAERPEWGWEDPGSETRPKEICYAKKFNPRKAKWEVEFKAQKSKQLFSTDSEKHEVFLIFRTTALFSIIGHG